MNRMPRRTLMGDRPVPRTLITIVVSGILLMNLAALLLSFAPVSNGVMDEFESSIEGILDLPYLPSEEDSILLLIENESETGYPFGIDVLFPEGMIPYITHRLHISGSGVSFSLPLWPDKNGSGSMRSYCNGIPYAGSFQVSLERFIGDQVERIDIGSIEVVEASYSGYLATTSPKGIEVGQEGIHFMMPDTGTGPIPRITYRINEGPLVEPGGLLFIDAYDVRCSDLGPGINIVKETSEFPNGSVVVRDLLFLNTLRSPIMPPVLDIDVKRVFEGSDDLYEQEPDGWMDAGDDQGFELFSREYHYVNVTFNRTHSLGTDPGDLILDIDGARYPLFYRSNGSYQGTFLSPSTLDEGGRISVLHKWYGNEYALDRFDVQLRRDRASHMSISPDPFEIGFYDQPLPPSVNVYLYAEWADFNRKDFASDPEVRLGDEPVIPEIEDSMFNVENNYSIGVGNMMSGKSLEVRSTTSFRYGAILTFLLPAPRIFYYIPYILEGPLALSFFMMISLSVIASISVLFYKSIRGSGKTPKDSNGKGKERSEQWMINKDSPLFITAKVYVGALFFFYMSFFMFQIFDTPTPGLSILSSQTPIWMRMFTLAEASVWEEVSGRMVLIGIPITIYHLIKGKGLTSFKNLFGGSGRFGTLEVFLILISGALFGVAHLGWGPWKMLPTFVHGLMFGYLFIKVGLHATIAVHFLFDYTSFLPEMTGLGDRYYFFFFIMTLFIGGMYIGEFTRRIQLWIARRTSPRLARSELLLVLHSLFCMIIALMLTIQDKGRVYVTLLMLVPFLDIAAYWISSRRINAPLIDDEVQNDQVLGILNRILYWSGRLIGYTASYISLAGSAFGFAWFVSEEKR